MLAAENWCVKVQDKIYGPYTTQQMRNFAHQGRLARWSLVAPAGAQSWREARSEIAFAKLFAAEIARAEPAAYAAPAFGKRQDCNNTVDIDGAETGGTQNINAAARPAQSDADKAASPAMANFIVIFDVVSAAASRAEAALHGLGAAFRLADNVWHVTCELTAVGVRNAITPYLRGSESIFVVDATRGRTSWGNYAPEPNAKIASAYMKAMQ